MQRLNPGSRMLIVAFDRLSKTATYQLPTELQLMIGLITRHIALIFQKCDLTCV